MTYVRWVRLRAKSGPGDTTADRRYSVHRNGNTGVWFVRDHGDNPPEDRYLDRHGRVTAPRPTMRQCRAWVMEQYR
jgi:hypothetical protein